MNAQKPRGNGASGDGMAAVNNDGTTPARPSPAIRARVVVGHLLHDRRTIGVRCPGCQQHHQHPISVGPLTAPCGAHYRVVLHLGGDAA